ncbi:MAG: hypothetical protein ACLQUZ_16520 [Rhizomicrobium sp.]
MTMHIRLHLAAALAFALLARPASADTVSTASSNGFGRIVFTLTPAARARAALAGSVLTISFDRRIAIDANAIVQGLPGYVASGRTDAGGHIFRFALAQNVRLHTSTSADKLAVDLAPDSFMGTPPDLPPPPPKELPAVDVQKLAVLSIRAGAYANFSRIVFDWPRNVQYTVFAGSGRITIRFNAMMRPDFTGFQEVSPPWVKDAGWRIEDGGTVIEFDTDTQSRYHDFRDGTKIVLDILAPKADAAAYRPPTDSGSTVARPDLIQIARAAKVDDSSPQAKAIAEAAARLNPSAEPKPAAASQTANAPTAAHNPSAASAAAPPATSAETAPQGAIADTASAQAERTRHGVIINFPGASTQAAAVFVRGMTAWIVIDGVPRIDPVQLKTALGDFPSSLDEASGNGVTTVRIGLKQAEQIAARAAGSNLIVEISPHAHTTPIAIGFVRDDDDPKQAALTTIVSGATHAAMQTDPAAGDTLIVVPGVLGRAVTDPRSYAEFAVLPTAAGLAIEPYTDDLVVRVAQGRVTITRPGGLALTTAPLVAAQTPAGLAHSNDSPAFLDLANWGRAADSNFLDTQRRLRIEDATEVPEEANRARLALARFYLGNEFAAEALGLINLMQTTNPALQGDVQLQTMRAAANFMMGRYRDAHNDIAGSIFDNDRHAAFWRGLTEAALENWNGARKALALAEPVLHRYPPAWQARARLAEADAALASNTVEDADAALGHLPHDLPRDLALQAQLARARLYALEDRPMEAHALFLSIENSGDERAAAQAIYADVDTGLVSGIVPRDKAIAMLEKLRFRWRGDALELKTLRKLGALYFAKKRWREGLQILRVASRNFPNDDLARQAQDDMRNTFETLFLKGKADTMPPIQALSLFYDFIDLTPIGPNGDEMIRRMADRLVAVDLLGPAENLLHYQVTNRLDGMARSQVATRLAMIDLMDHKPKDALETLRSTEIAGLPDDVNHGRVLLEARALAALKQWDQALDLIAADEAPDTRRLRSDIYWESGNWAIAAQKSEELVGDRWSDAIPLSAAERGDLMRAAVAYSLAGDETSLDRLRTRFAAKMKTSPDASAFAVVTQNIDQQGVAFRDLAGKIASIDTLERFMDDFHAHYDGAKTTN